MTFLPWAVTIVGVFFAFAGVFFLYKTLTLLKGRFKQSMKFLFFASLFGASSHAIIAYFGTIGLDIGSEYWSVIPVFFTMAMIFVVLSMRELVEMFTALSRFKPPPETPTRPAQIKVIKSPFEAGHLKVP